MAKNTHRPRCLDCDEEYSTERWRLGYIKCKDCGERHARKAVHTIVPMHKSNYMLVTRDSRELLKGLNKYGL